MPRGRPKKVQTPPQTPIVTEVVEQTTTARPVEVIQKELAETKQNLDKIKAADKVEIGKDFDAEIDNYAVPKEIQDAYPDMHFHWSRSDPKDISRKMSPKYQYQVVHIPASCRDLLAVYKSLPRSPLTDAFGDDIIARGLPPSGLVLMMCPKSRYEKNKQKLEDLRKARNQENSDKDTDNIKKSLGKDIKSARISIN